MKNIALKACPGLKAVAIEIQSIMDFYILESAPAAYIRSEIDQVFIVRIYPSHLIWAKPFNNFALNRNRYFCVRFWSRI